ncbi:putative RNA helicase [Microsporum ferrugineum]
MAPNKKKKKAASNPARGFATVSVPSKVKPQSSTEPAEPESAAGSDVLSDKPPAEASQDADAAQAASHKPELHELTPDELERHLEEAELQAIVDKHGIKCKGDAARYSIKLAAEKRLLRSQATLVDNISDWLSPDLLDKILEKEKAEAKKQPVVSNKTEYNGQLTLPVEENVCINMWILRLTLLELGFQEADIDVTLKNLLIHGPLEKISGKDPIPALDQAFYYLALFLNKDSLTAYDKSKPLERIGKVITIGEDAISLLPERIASRNSSPVSHTRSSTPSKSPEAISTRISRPPSPESEGDSNLHDPEMLVPEFLALRSRLYELDPFMFNKTKSKKVAKQGSKQTQDQSRHPTVANIKRKLARIEQDILFDAHEAEERWAERLEELRHATGESLRKSLSSPKVIPNVLDTELNETPAKDTLSEEDEGLFGEMFDLGINDTKGQLLLGVTNTTIKLRDFGKSALEIKWSKDQDITFETPLNDVQYSISPQSLILYMTGISAVSDLQAESYISTVALFVLLSHAWKESKASVKLTGIWKDVWDEIVQEKKEYDDNADRQTVKIIKGYIQEYEGRLEEDVVLIHNFRQRNGTGDVTPAEEVVQRKHNSDIFSPDLQSLWTDRSSSPSFQRMTESRAGLPIWSFRGQVIDALARN